MEFQESCQNRIFELLAEYGSYVAIERVAKNLGRPGPSAQTLGKIVSGQCAGSLRTYMGLMTLPDKPPVSD